jgi:cystathionine beta-lyase/cystathionine gamma-synthase
MDNTWSTPLFQKPIEVGVDIVVHSLTKYVGGHSDVVAGAVITSARLMEQIFYRAFMLNGGILGPFDAWLLARGIRTLPIRLERHQSNALAVAEFLSQHASVRRVFHPALDPEDRDLAASQLAGYSGLLSFELATDEFAAVADFIDGLKMFRIGVSWGGFESLVVSPNRGDNGDSLAAQGIPPGLVRLSVGLEDADQLKKDLAQALS